MITSSYDRLEYLLRGSEGERIRAQDQFMRSNGESEIITILTSNSSRLADIGPLVTRTDREIRRAAVILGDMRATVESYNFGYGPGHRPRPLPASAGGLLVTEASSGSLSLVVEAYGAVTSLLTSQPVSAFVALLTLSQSTGSIRIWFNRRKKELDGVSARNALPAFEAFGGDTAVLMSSELPDQELEIRPAPDEQLLATNRSDDLATAPRISQASLMVGDIVARGSRITHIHKHLDGSEDIIYVDA